MTVVNSTGEARYKISRQSVTGIDRHGWAAPPLPWWTVASRRRQWCVVKFSNFKHSLLSGYSVIAAWRCTIVPWVTLWLHSTVQNDFPLHKYIYVEYTSTHAPLSHNNYYFSTFLFKFILFYWSITPNLNLSYFIDQLSHHPAP